MTMTAAPPAPGETRAPTAKEAYHLLRVLQAQPLAAKVDRALAIIGRARDAFGSAGGVAVAFSGGRDSTALAILTQRVAPDWPIMYVDTGTAQPGLTAWVKRFAGDRLVHIQPEGDMLATWQAEGFYPIGGKISGALYRRDNPDSRANGTRCCEVHKARPARRWMRESGARCLVYGVRGEDSKRHRFKLVQGELFPSGDGWHLAYPILTWTRADVAAFLADACPDYPLRYSRHEEPGCRFCAVDLTLPQSNLATLRQTDRAAHLRAMETGMGAEILMLRYNLTRAGAEALIARDGLEALADAGAFDRIPGAERPTLR